MKTNINQRITVQILLWGSLFFGLPIAVTGEAINMHHINRATELTLSVGLIVFLNSKYLFPRFYKGGNVIQYLLMVIVVIISIRVFLFLLVYTFQPDILWELELRWRGGEGNHLQLERFYFVAILMGGLPMLLATFANTVTEAFIWVSQSTREAAQLKSEKLEAELKFLKSQINPHFLFNALNNIYTLTVINPPIAGNSLLKLSEMLRYLLYECDADKVRLDRELTYLRNYIDLFELKDEEPLNITFDAQDVETDVLVAPLLFIPFVENAFKHSQIEDLENGWIIITILGDTEQLYFEVKNSVPELAFSKDSVGGIGLKNVRRQLELLYPNKHQLEVERESGCFGVYLTLYLDE